MPSPPHRPLWCAAPTLAPAVCAASASAATAVAASAAPAPALVYGPALPPRVVSRATTALGPQQQHSSSNSTSATPAPTLAVVTAAAAAAAATRSSVCMTSQRLLRRSVSSLLARTLAFALALALALVLASPIAAAAADDAATTASGGAAGAAAGAKPRPPPMNLAPRLVPLTYRVHHELRLPFDHQHQQHSASTATGTDAYPDPDTDVTDDAVTAAQLQSESQPGGRRAWAGYRAPAQWLHGLAQALGPARQQKQQDRQRASSDHSGRAEAAVGLCWLPAPRAAAVTLTDFTPIVVPYTYSSGSTDTETESAGANVATSDSCVSVKTVLSVATALANNSTASPDLSTRLSTLESHLSALPPPHRRWLLSRAPALAALARDIINSNNNNRIKPGSAPASALAFGDPVRATQLALRRLLPRTLAFAVVPETVTALSPKQLGADSDSEGDESGDDDDEEEDDDDDYDDFSANGVSPPPAPTTPSPPQHQQQQSSAALGGGGYGAGLPSERDASVAGDHGAALLWARNATGRGVTVAVLDTGAPLAHPHLAALRARVDFTGEAAPGDALGHGTFVAAAVAGGGPSPCPGMAPGARLLSLRVFSRRRVSHTGWFLDALAYALQAGADVVNLSVGGPDHRDAPFVARVREASAAGALIVSAVGNDGPVWGSLSSPADQEDVLAVGAATLAGGVAPFSSRGAVAWSLPKGPGRVKPDLLALGKNLRSSAPLDNNNNNAHSANGNSNAATASCRALSGTSVAAPVVAGAAALLLSALPRAGAVLPGEAAHARARGLPPPAPRPRRALLNPAALKQLLLATARPLAGASLFEQGAGLLDAPAALDALARYRRHASLFPPLVDARPEACPRMAPFCEAPLAFSQPPLSVNFTVLSALAPRSRIVAVRWEVLDVAQIETADATDAADATGASTNADADASADADGSNRKDINADDDADGDADGLSSPYLPSLEARRATLAALAAAERAGDAARARRLRRAAAPWLPLVSARTGETYYEHRVPAAPPRRLRDVLTVTFAHSQSLWPWSGHLALALAVTHPLTVRTQVHARLTVTVEADADSGDGAEGADAEGGEGGAPAGVVRSDAVARLVLVLAPTPPRARRVAWDQFHSLRYPHGYVPRDSLEARADALDWLGDSLASNFRPLALALRARGLALEPVSRDWTSLDARLYGALLVVDPEEELFAAERAALLRAVRDRGLGLLLAADWYNAAVLRAVAFFDDNTQRTWVPVTGGGNLPALNELLAPLGAALGDSVYKGRLRLAPPLALANSTAPLPPLSHYGSGAGLVRWPRGGHLLAAPLTDITPAPQRARAQPSAQPGAHNSNANRDGDANAASAAAGGGARFEEALLRTGSAAAAVAEAAPANGATSASAHASDLAPVSGGAGAESGAGAAAAAVRADAEASLRRDLAAAAAAAALSHSRSNVGVGTGAGAGPSGPAVGIAASVRAGAAAVAARVLSPVADTVAAAVGTYPPLGQQQQSSGGSIHFDMSGDGDLSTPDPSASATTDGNDNLVDAADDYSGNANDADYSENDSDDALSFVTQPPRRWGRQLLQASPSGHGHGLGAASGSGSSPGPGAPVLVPVLGVLQTRPLTPLSAPRAGSGAVAAVSALGHTAGRVAVYGDSQCLDGAHRTAQPCFDAVAALLAYVAASDHSDAGDGRDGNADAAAAAAADVVVAETVIAASVAAAGAVAVTAVAE